MSQMEEHSCPAAALTPSEWEEILELTHAAFAEHQARGLRMSPCSITLVEHQKFLESCQIFQIRHNGVLVAYKAGFVVHHKDSTYFQVRLTCVSPESKGKGLGKRVHRLLEDWAVNQGCRYLLTDTSCKAAGSRAYHRACGFEDWYFKHWPTTNYYTIVLRKELPEGRRMSRKMRYKSLIQSYISVHFRYKENGEERMLYKWIKWLFGNKS